LQQIFGVIDGSQFLKNVKQNKQAIFFLVKFLQQETFSQYNATKYM
jgi:hypothetical protein